MNTDEQSEVLATKEWLDKIIIGLNICPFAKKEFVNNSIHYHLSKTEQVKTALHEFIEQCRYLQTHEDLETTLIIYGDGFRGFERYLDLVDYANDLLVDSGFEGIFQIASMHPEYCFDGDDYDDASNFTNRSPYPIIQLLRQAPMTKALTHVADPEKIYTDNIKTLDKLGRRKVEALCPWGK